MFGVWEAFGVVGFVLFVFLLLVCLFIFSSSVHSPASYCVEKLEVMIWFLFFCSFFKAFVCT